ncbi:FadR/GntR family transcriptional regulator, partial [Mycolicibacterium sphagni]
MADVKRTGDGSKLVRAPKTAELIADQLRSQIVRGVLKEGDALPTEIELVKQFGVSRPTLREAFRILESESLIIVRRGSRGGVLVSSPRTSVAARDFGLLLQMSGATLADVYEARKVFEPAAAEMLARRAAAEDIAELTGAADALAALVAEG